jgi:hypothetical protein
VVRVESKVSAANVGVLNVGSSFGFKWSKPEATFYWHAPGAAHIVAPAGLTAVATASGTSRKDA